MTTTPQTEASRLADAIDPGEEGSKVILTIDASHAAAELRRLDAENQRQRADLERKSEAIQRLWAERDQLRAQLAEAVASKCELLEALDLMEKAQAHIDGLPMFPTTHATEGARFKLFDARQAARAAIAKATGERHD